jgi:hypothetical protein
MTGEQTTGKREILLVSDFDQTLSYNDSGIVLCEMLGILGFQERVAGLSKIHLVQQGGELPYLLLHDPEFRRVRKEHLSAVGKSIRLKPILGICCSSWIKSTTITLRFTSSRPRRKR